MSHEDDTTHLPGTLDGDDHLPLDGAVRHPGSRSERRTSLRLGPPVVLLRYVMRLIGGGFNWSEQHQVAG